MFNWFELIRKTFENYGIDPMFGSFVLGFVFCLMTVRRKKGIVSGEVSMFAKPAISFGADGSALIDGKTFTLSKETLAKVSALMQSRKKIDAIKVVREETGMGLMEAKLLVEAYQEQGAVK